MAKNNLNKKQDFSCLMLHARGHHFLCEKIGPRLCVDYGLLISNQEMAQYILFVSFPHSEAGSLSEIYTIFL